MTFWNTVISMLHVKPIVVRKINGKLVLIDRLLTKKEKDNGNVEK